MHITVGSAPLARWSDQISRSVVSDSFRPHELQHTRPPCPSPTPRVHWDSRPLSQWCHPAISSSVVPFSSPLISSSILGTYWPGEFLFQFCSFKRYIQIAKAFLYLHTFYNHQLVVPTSFLEMFPKLHSCIQQTKSRRYFKNQCKVLSMIPYKKFNK